MQKRPHWNQRFQKVTNTCTVAGGKKTSSFVSKVRRKRAPCISHYLVLTLQKLLLCCKCLRQSSRKIEERGKNNSPFLLLSFPVASWWHKACYHHPLQKNVPKNILMAFTTFSGKVGLDRPIDLSNKSTFQSQCKVRIEVELELTS